MVRDLTQEIAETDDFLPFWYRGTRDEFFSAGAGMDDGREKREEDGRRKMLQNL
jgi:hypothetical protein